MSGARLLVSRIAWLISLFGGLALADDRRAWQPVIDYTISFPGDRPDAAPTINPFENFTHIGTDFGWMGPGGSRIDAKSGIIRVKPAGEWTGAWHSLSGLAAEPNRTLDPTDLLQLGGDPAERCVIRNLVVHAAGRGTLRLELADVNRNVVWQVTETLNHDSFHAFTYPIAADAVGPLKVMNWIAEPGCEVRLSSIGFLAERPDVSPEEWAFRISLGKLRRCHDAIGGLTRDRAHLPAGKFDSIASTGMHALASALAFTEGIVDLESASGEIERTLAALEALPTAAGFLPHFTQRGDDGKAGIVPGTEFSTVDTAIALTSMLLATRVVGDEEMNGRVAAMIARLDFDAVTDADGWISHGYLDDGTTLLESSWRDWGGETALVLMLESMVPGRQPRGKMIPSGEPYRGVGFIAEIQSLFFPDFDREQADVVTGMNWPKIRRKILAEQIAYFREHLPDAAAAGTGIFGLSAGESGMPGAGYTANGTEVMGVRWIHPHFMFMGLGLTAPSRYRDGLQALASRDFLYPHGLPENIEADLVLHNPMQGSLNASFETLSSYHGWKRRQSPANAIDLACLRDPLLRKAAARFFPEEE